MKERADRISLALLPHMVEVDDLDMIVFLLLTARKVMGFESRAISPLAQ